MKKLFVVFALTLSLTPLMFAQQPQDTREEQLAAMKKLSNWVGTWSGTGWSQMGPGERRESMVTETIQSKLDGLLLVVDGEGKNSAGQVVHKAFGVMSYDPQKKGYRFATYTKEGRTALADANFEGDKFVWGFDTPMGAIRYTITLTATEWTEVGERSRDKQSWQKFFEMKLKKQ